MKTKQYKYQYNGQLYIFYMINAEISTLVNLTKSPSRDEVHDNPHLITL